MLGASVTADEVRRALFSMGNYKAPGPDGFHPLFFKAKWDILGQDIIKFVERVFNDPSLIGSVNHTLLTLIPKVDEPTRAVDFRPIPICNVIYKVITKVLSSRIGTVLPHIISKNQSSLYKVVTLMITQLFCRRQCTR